MAVWLLVIATMAGTTSGATFYQAGTTGYDVSFAQCGARLPNGAFGIVGVTNGLPWSANPCLGAQFQWADGLAGPASFYTNTANPGPQSIYWNLGGPKTCTNPSSYSDAGCSYNYGWKAAEQAFVTAASATSASDAADHFWWLDVETMNSWNGSKAANAATVQGYYDYFVSRGVPGVGIYSTGYQWGVITGGYKLAKAPNWVAGVSSLSTAKKNCTASFTGGPVYLGQYYSKGFDANYACSGTASQPAPTPTPKSKRR
jgi:hypothetical protein